MGSERCREPESTGSIVVTILSEIGQREGYPPQELTPPLYTVIDPDALEALFRDPTPGESRDPVTVEFTYLDYRIVVRGPNEIEIHDSRDDGPIQG